MRVFWVVVLTMLAAGACTSSTSPTLEPEAPANPVADAVSNWNDADVNSYLVRAVDNDSASSSAGCTWITEVHGARIDLRWTAMFDVECGERDVSVPALHDRLTEYSDEVDQDRGRLDVEWSDLGVPTQIEFSPAVGDVVVLTIEFRELDAQQSVRADLATARSRWSQAGISDYRLELAELQNYWSRGCRWTSVVSGDSVIEKSAESETNSSCQEIDWTVEVLFEMVASWADTIDEFADPAFGEHELVVRFDENGVPETLIYDLANGDDEETSLQVAFVDNATG